MNARVQRRLELTFLGLGSAAAVLYIALSLPSIWTRHAAIVKASSQDGDVIPTGSIGAAYGVANRPLPKSSVIGTIHIASLHLDAPIVEGVDDDDLRRGVGHMPGTALAGGLGNVILAAHRDGIFRPLQSIGKGMDIAIQASDGTYHYQVDSTAIVMPNQLDVLAVGDSPEVTLITCYPFHFIGHAPKRFIVKAHLISTLPDTFGGSRTMTR